MQDNTPHHDNRFFNGFIIGLILGAAVVFLFGTKRGKKILKTISEEGLENITKVLEEIEDEEIVDQDFVEDVPEPVKSATTKVEASEPEVKIKKPRRFFKKKK